MNTMIDPLKRIARDLVDKKLWPVAVLLLAALVAVPLLIGGGASTDDAAAPVAVAATAPGAPGSKSLITVVDPAASGKDSRPGAVKDPFYDPPEPPAAESASAPGTAVSGGATTGGGGATTGGGTPGGATPTAGTPPRQSTAPRQTTPRQPVEPVVAPVYHRTVVRWYQAEAGKPRPLTRLTPLGDPGAPVALYLGVTRSDASYAVFLLSPHAASDGDAECEEADCRVIGLKAGQSQIVTMQPPDGAGARRYRLEVVSVKAVATDADKAREMRAKVHSDGRDVMRAMWQHRPTAEALRPIRYDLASGLLFKIRPAAKKASQ